MPAQRPSIVCTGGIIAGLQGEYIHTLMVAGGLVMQHAPDGDWKRVDWDALAAWLDRYGYSYKVADCETETLPTAEAARRLREWERKGKSASSLNQ